jgi:hypothetical protein
MNLQATISDLENALFGLHPDAKKLYEAIDALKVIDVSYIKNGDLSYAIVKTNPTMKYDSKANMRSKALFAIKELNRFVKNKEIANFLHEREPGVSVKDFVTALSNPLFFLKNEQRVHKISVGTGNMGVYWGSLKWLNEDGTVKQEHMYIEEAKEAQIEI